MVEGEALGTLGSFEDEEMGRRRREGRKLAVEGSLDISFFFLTSKIRNNEED